MPHNKYLSQSLLKSKVHFPNFLNFLKRFFVIIHPAKPQAVNGDAGGGHSIYQLPHSLHVTCVSANA